MAEPLTSERLLEIASQAGHPIGKRTLELWSYQGLLPHAVRVGQEGRRPIWVYPAGTDEQFLSILSWRAEGVTAPDAMRVGLWVEGYRIPWEAARKSAFALLEGTLRKFARALEPYGGFDLGDPETTSQAIDRLAFRDAGRRGQHYHGARSVRMKRSDRAQALAYVRRILLGLEAEGGVQPDAAALVVRDFGIRRRGAPDLARSLFGFAPTALAEVGRWGGIPGLSKAIETASDDEASAARAFAYLALTGFIPMTKTLESVLGVAPGELAGGPARPRPRELALLVGFLIAAFRRGTDEDVSQLFGPQPPLRVLQGHAERMAKRSDRALEEDAAMLIGELSSTPPSRRSTGERRPQSRQGGHTGN